MKKIALIEPCGSTNHVFSSVRMPRLGLPLLGTILRDAGYTVSLHVGKGADLPWPEILKSDLVGVSTTSSTSSEAYRIAGYLRTHRIPVVIGGIHATFYANEALSYADYVVRGEADHTFLKLVQTIQDNGHPGAVPGVSFRDGKSVIHNPLPDQPVDLDDLPAPDFSLFGPRPPFRSVPVMTSRGCPYSCIFCCVTAMFGRRYRFRSTDLVLEELARYHGRPVFFCDDNFTANARRSKELLRGLLDQGIKLKSWGAQVRVEVARDQEMMELLQRAGCRILYVGLESINPATLESYNKGQTVDDVRYFVDRCHDYRIRVHGMFVFGGDEDTAQIMPQTADFALQSRVDSVQFATLTPLPGTPLFEQLDREQRIFTYNWDLYDGHHAVFQPRGMTAKQLQHGSIAAMKRFYGLRHLFQNLRLTGWGSVFYRGVGWWLVRSFGRQNRWYQQALPGLETTSSRPAPLLFRRVSPAQRIRGRVLVPRPDSSLRIYITERKGVLHLRLKGLLDRPSLREVRRTMARLLPGRSFHVVVNARGLTFTSDRVVRSFSVYLERLGDQVRRLQVVARVEQGLPRLPRFELILDQ